MTLEARRVCAKLWAAVLAGLMLLSSALAAPLAEGLSLEAPQRAWLASHRTWRVGVLPDWPPVDQLDTNGNYTGLSAEVLNEVARRLGVSISVVSFTDYRQALQAAQDGQLEVLTSVTRSPGRERQLLFSHPYARLAVAYLGRQDLLGFSESPDFGGRVVAVERGFITEELMRTRFPSARLLSVGSTLEALRAVAAGKADIYRGALLPAHYLIERELITNLAIVNRDSVAPSELSFASPHPEAIAALDAALAAIGDNGLRAITSKWQPLYVNLMPRREAVLPSAAAAQGLGEVKVAYDAGFSPLSRQELDGSAGGLSIEILRRSAEAAGVRYRFIAKPSFGDAVQSLRSGQADVVVAAVRTPEREEFARFVGPYYKSPSVIVSRIGETWTSLAELSGQSLAIDRNHYLIGHIQRTAPGVRIVAVQNVGEVLQAVAEGRVDAGLTNVEYAASSIPERYAGKLQVTGIVEEALSELSFMVRKDREDIAWALAAGLDAIPTAERRTIANAQLRTKIATGLDWRSVATVVAPVLAALTGLLVASLIYTRRLRAARRKLREQRDAAERQAQAKADFLADVGHDVRTPLAALAKGLQLLQKESLTGKAQDMAGLLQGSAERLVGLLNELLDIAKLESGRLELVRRPADLLQLVSDAAEQFRPLATSRNVDLLLEMPTRLPLLMLDAARTVQVVSNLLSNALKFTEQGMVRVSLTAKPIAIRQWKVTLVVADTGAGMDEITRAGLFERFKQGSDAQRMHGGHGLGLSIVSQILQLAQGRVQVRSELGRGTEVEVTVLAEEANEPAPRSSADALRNILLVDDDAVVRIVLSEQLRSRGFDVCVASTASEALERLPSGGFDLLIADANLGTGMSGLALASQAKIAVTQPDLRILILSGDASPQEIPPSIDGWVQKPVSPADQSWLQAVTRVLNPVQPPPNATVRHGRGEGE